VFVTVNLLNNFKKPLTYAVPQELQEKICKGALVEVPLRNYTTSAFVEAVFFKNKSPFKIRNILGVVEMPEDKNYIPFLQKISFYYQTPFLFFLKRMKSFLFQEEKKERKRAEEAIERSKSVILTEDQQKVYEGIRAHLSQGYSTSVLHGVTGSGKTEVYNNLIKDVLADQKTVLFLVPEVTLALHFEMILKKSHGQDLVFGFHSASSVVQKRKLWKSLKEKSPIIVVGVHLPLFLPISNLGIIIVDEEHEQGFQEKKHPKVHTRDMAILRAQLYKVPILLGSATPSIATLWNAKKRGWSFFELKKRFSGAFPEIKIVSLQQKSRRKHFWISPELHKAIETQLHKKEQTILFLNRRGMNFFVQCPCGSIFSCNNCSVSLTVHSGDKLVCHYCGYKKPMPKKCEDCGVDEKEFIKKGIGTQRLVTIVQKMYPQARVARLDLDTVAKKKQSGGVIDGMNNREVDILIGTQSVTKGYHFPGVTLVGVVWADLNMHFPIYNAVETTIQQLIQVAGRAGRQSEKSQVIIQCFDQHEAFNYLNEEKYQQFYEYEIRNRTKISYPPVAFLADVEMRSMNQEQVASESQELVDLLQQVAEKNDLKVDVLGPVPAVVSKIKSVYIQKIFLKGEDRMAMINLFQAASQETFSSAVFFTMNPVS
jgi:primosomal protein N' (replication factor Y) (superfamily II helicase)